MIKRGALGEVKRQFGGIYLAMKYAKGFMVMSKNEILA